MIIVDTYCHTSIHWNEPIETLMEYMSRNNVDKALLQPLPAEYDASYLLECKRRFPGRFSVIVLVDTQKPDAPETLERWVEKGAEGVRMDPTLRSPGGDPAYTPSHRMVSPNAALSRGRPFGYLA